MEAIIHRGLYSGEGGHLEWFEHSINEGRLKLRLPLSNFIKYKTMDTPKTVFILIQFFD